MLFTKRFPLETFQAALESWDWLGVKGKTPVLCSLFGDVFLQDPKGFWFLDSLEGTLTHVAVTAAELQAIINTAEGQDKYLLVGLAQATVELGISLGQDQVYDFIIPPVLGGALEPTNIKAGDFSVVLNLAGQIHKQVHDVPPGTKIGQITIDGKKP